MPDARVSATQLRGQRWRETVHELLQGVDEPVDPLVERAGDELARRYRDAGDFDDLDRARVAEVVNLLNDRDLGLAERWLFRQPYVLVRALEWAQSREPADDEALTTGTVEYVEEQTVPLLARLLVREATRPDALSPEVRDLHLQPGEVDEQALVDRLRERGLEIRAGRAVGAVISAITEARSAEGTTAERLDEQPPVEQRRRAEPEVETPGEGDLGDGLGLANGTPLRDLCAFGLPTLRQPLAARPAGSELLRAARLASFLYLFSERQPLLAAMDTLHSQVMTTALLNRLGGNERDDTREKLCDLRLLVYSWGHRVFPVSVEQRAAAAAAIGIRDCAASVPANTRFSEAMEQLVRLLGALATDRCDDTLLRLRPAARVAALRVAAALDGAMTGETLLTIGLWRREFALAHHVLTLGALRLLLGGPADPDRGPAPAIRRILPDVEFDPSALAEEWRALRKIFRFVRRAASRRRWNSDLDSDLSKAADAAVTLLVLKGRLRPRSIGVDFSGAGR